MILKNGVFSILLVSNKNVCKLALPILIFFPLLYSLLFFPVLSLDSCQMSKDVAILRNTSSDQQPGSIKSRIPLSAASKFSSSSYTSQVGSSPSRRSRLVESIVHDWSRPLHADLCDGKEATTLDGAWEAANPIHPITGMYSLRDLQEDDTSANIVGYELAKVSNITSPFGTPAKFKSSTGGTLSASSSVSLELCAHMLEQGAASLGLCHQEGSWAFPLFLIEKSYTPSKLRQTLTEILFEQIGVPKLFLGKDAAMACYAVGRATGIVVDIGGLGTTVSPVHEGW